MNVGSLCTRHVVTVDHRAPLSEGAALMRQHHVGALVVTTLTEVGTTVVGVITDRDLVVEALAAGTATSDVRVGQMMHEPPVTVSEAAGLDQALEHMQRQGVRRLLVTDEAGQLAGIVTLDDLVAGLAAALGLLAQVISAGRDREARGRPGLPPPPLPRLHIPAIGTAGWRG